MKRKPLLRFFVIAEAALFTGFGLILKNMDDSFGDHLLWIGSVLLIYFSFRAFIKLTLRKPHNNEVIQ